MSSSTPIARSTVERGIDPEPPHEAPIVLYSSWNDVLAAAPPRNVSKRLSRLERAMLGELQRELDTAYAAVKAVWNAVPVGSPREADCRDGWHAIGDALEHAYVGLRALEPGLCASEWTNPPTAGLRRRRHRLFLYGVLQQRTKTLSKDARERGTDSFREWSHALEVAVSPPPLPCLSCLEPSVTPLKVAVYFAPDASHLDLDDPDTASALQLLATQITDRLVTHRERLMVRGHANANERDIEALGLARARSVIAWLSTQSIDEARLQAWSLGAEAPVGPSQTREGAAENRRVDFESVGKLGP